MIKALNSRLCDLGPNLTMVDLSVAEIVIFTVGKCMKTIHVDVCHVG